MTPRSRFAGASALVRVRVSSRRGASIDRAVEPTPYEVQLLAEDLSYAGRGSRVEVDVTGAGDGVVKVLEAAMAKLTSRGIEVSWHSLVGGRDEASPPAP